MARSVEKDGVLIVVVLDLLYDYEIFGSLLVSPFEDDIHFSGVLFYEQTKRWMLAREHACRHQNLQELASFLTSFIDESLLHLVSGIDTYSVGIVRRPN
mmetsp:Transcript_31529/g.45936  ORF Transcript_31529/g.45936 Transcript_31529/m.45936 type:complete len:99 (+) Transcript_31529:679-975(+)